MRIFLIVSFMVVVTCGQSKTCSNGEELKSCGTACEPTCENRSPICTEQCLVNACQCPDGFVRHNGKCIFPAMCPKTCGENEEIQMCGTACEPSCAVPDPTICTMQCLVNVCQCKSGFVRNTEGACVRQSECPPMAPTEEVIEGEED